MSTSLRLSFFAASRGSANSQASAAHIRGVVRALAQRGHRVTFYEPDAVDDDAAALAMLERAAACSDVLVKTSGIGCCDRWLEEAVPQAARPGTTTIFWDVDPAATLERMRADESDPFRGHVSRYDMVFTYGGGDRVVRAYEALGARSCTPIHNALDPQTNHPVNPDERFAAKLGLLAHREPDRDARVQEFFLKPARKLAQESFLLGGSDWPLNELPPNVRAIGHVPAADHNAFNSTPLAVLNVARERMVTGGFSPATRVFEAAGAAACLITDAWEGVEAFLEPGREVLVAQDGDHVASILASLSADRARIIGQNARRRMLAEHTYDVRALQVETILLVRTHKHRGSESGAWA